MELHCKLLLYLDRRRYLEEMKTTCENYVAEMQASEKLQISFPPLTFLLEVDVMEVLDTLPEVGEFLIKEPLQWQRVCSQILHATLQSLKEEVTQNVQIGQVTVFVRLKSIPKLIVPHNARVYSGIVCFEGILLSVSKPASYVYHSVWSCPEECEGNEVVLGYTPKFSPRCCVCKSVLFENSGFRRCGEQVTASFIIDGELCAKEFKIVDDLIPRLDLGTRFILHAVVLKKLTSVWSIEESIPLAAPITHPIPKDILELHEVCHGIPWKFIYCLASTIGVNICPLNCFMHLKISLLMSLTSIKANILTGSNIMHVLTAGFDSRYVGQLMMEASRLAERATFLGTSKTNVATALLASSGGPCVMPLPLHGYNQKQVSSVLAAIESGEVTLETGKAKLRCAVWAHGMDFKKIVLHNVGSVFGSVCRGDFGDFGDEIADFVLERSMDPHESSAEEKQALREVSLYIDLVAGLEVMLDSSAETLLRNYFLSARRKRPREVTVGSMKALVAACVTSARLCRRTVAGADDAVLAIWLLISGSPEPRFAPEEYLQTPGDVKELSKTMNSFKDWLEQFTGTCIIGMK